MSQIHLHKIFYTTVIMAPQDIVVPCETPYPLRIAFVEGKAGEIIEFFDEK